MAIQTAITFERPPSHRTKIVAFRLTPGDYERLHALANARGMQIGEWCRDLALQFARNPEGDGFQQAVLGEVIAVRDTINQLAYYDAEGYRVTVATLQALLKEIEKSKRTKALNLLRRLHDDSHGVPPPQEARDKSYGKP